MIWLRPILFTGIFILAGSSSYCQISEFGIPYSFSDNLHSEVEYIEVPAINKDSLLRQDAFYRNQGYKNNRFASMIPLNITPFNSGRWENTDQGRIWRVGIHAANAYSLYCVLDHFRLKNGCRLYIYDPQFREIRGGFSNKNNNRDNNLAIAPLASDSLILELNVPFETINFGDIHLSEVGYDYINAFGKKSDAFLKDNIAGSCEVDINCPEGAAWQIEKRAVCLLIIGGYYCTGSLIGNTSQLRIPYFLTAYHCVLNASTPSTALFYFNYEQPSCGGTLNIIPQTISGARLVSMTINKLDYALLQLDTFPPLSYYPYFLGWDNSGSIPQNGAVIHHPLGSDKKISLDELPLSTASFGGGFDPDAHWLVSNYSLGTTEPGSSGAPFFDTQHHVIGTLTGGIADCTSPDSDYYCKFSLSWNKYPDSTNQLKVWLDPSNSGVTYMNGYDPYGFNIQFCDTAWNFSKTETLQVPLGNFGDKWTASGSVYTQFAEKFYSPQMLELHGAFFDIASIHTTNALSAIQMNVWTGDTLPDIKIYSALVPLSNLQKNAINFIAFDTILKVTGNFFIGYSTIPLQPQDTFALYHTLGNGSYGPSTMYLCDQNWYNIDAVTHPALTISLGIGVTTCYGTVSIPQPVIPAIYPNPCTNYFNLTIPKGSTMETISCYEINGRIASLESVISDGNIAFELNLPSGVYILKVCTSTGLIIQKFVVLNH